VEEAVEVSSNPIQYRGRWWKKGGRRWKEGEWEIAGEEERIKLIIQPSGATSELLDDMAEDKWKWSNLENSKGSRRSLRGGEETRKGPSSPL